MSTSENTPSLEQAVSPAAIPFQALETLRLLVKAARPKQWAKNLIVFAPLIFSRNLDHPVLVLYATLCAFAFCLVSGAVYIINDVADFESDRQHPSKCARPIASGRLGKKIALAFALLLIVLGLALSYVVRPSLVLVTATYLMVSLLYCHALRHRVILDVFGIAAGFVLRAVSGAVAIGVASSGWFLCCTSLGALFLALEKRRQEMRILGDDAGDHRKALDGYSPDLLDRMESLIVPSLLTSYAFYSFMSFHGQWMMLTVPFVLYGVMRYQYLSVHSQKTAQPEDVLFSDRPIQITILCFLATSILVIYGLPGWVAAAFQTMDSYRIFK